MPSLTDKAKYYAKIQIETSAKPKIVCMLHERCTQLIRQSLSSESGYTSALIINAQNILAQLERSLKRTDDLSDGLFYLYDFCYCKLEKTDPQCHQAALEIMTILRDTFDQLLKS